MTLARRAPVKSIKIAAATNILSVEMKTVLSCAFSMAMVLRWHILVVSREPQEFFLTQGHRVSEFVMKVLPNLVEQNLAQRVTDMLPSAFADLARETDELDRLFAARRGKCSENSVR